MRLEGLAAEWLGLEVRGQAQLTRAADQVDLAVALTVNEIPYELRLTHTPGRGITATGSHALESRGSNACRRRAARGRSWGGR